ncbi:sensor histidine kinase [Marvinbryantia sp.]|uniref:sensor histidine kinase n=1 Tax=Marvinbryantia sp. TaxID=2496532 RepID=UPI0025FC1E17|nr:sensor histidine kinase [uncultured Marvinbryantia sp.]
MGEKGRIISGAIEWIPWLLQQFLVSGAYVLVCHGMLSAAEYGKKKRHWWLAEWAVLVAIFFCMGMGLSAFVIGSVFLMLWTCIQGVILAVYLRFFSDYRRDAKIILWCSMFAGMQALTSLSGQASYLVGETVAKGIPEAAARVLGYLLIPALAWYLIRFNFDDFEKLPAAGLTLILAGDVSLLVLVISESLWSTSEEAAVKRFLIMYLCFFLIVLVSIYVLYTICREQEQTLLLREEAQQLQKEKERFYMAEEQMQEIRSIRHDLKNQRHYMSILIKEKRYEELAHYFAESAQELPEQKMYVNCGNKSVNVILNMEYAKLEPDIQIDSLLVVPPVLPFADDELCSVLTNLLDNAMEECRRIKDDGNRQTIRLEMYPEANYLYIMCQNPTDRTELSYWKDGVRSTKEDAAHHGYGTQIVARIAEKYSGWAEYAVKDGCFAAKIMMDMTGGKTA